LDQHVTDNAVNSSCVVAKGSDFKQSL